MDSDIDKCTIAENIKNAQKQRAQCFIDAKRALERCDMDLARFYMKAVLDQEMTILRMKQQMLSN